MKLLAAPLAAAMLLAACGSDDDDSAGSASGADGAEGRTILHAEGETMVPDDVERVVVLDTPQLDAALALGITPVGAVRPDVGAGFPDYLDGADDIAEVGTIESPNLEAIAELEPDLVLSSSVRHTDLYDELSEIAPTVFSESTGGSWKEDFLLFADALGRETDAQALLDEYQQRADGLGTGLTDPQRTVGVVRFLPDQIRVYGPESFVGTVLTDVGVQLPASVRDMHDDIAIYPSAEQIDQASADVLYVTTWGDPAETTIGAVQAGPLWSTLPAVQQGRVHNVSDDVWMLGIGILGAHAVLDDLEATLGT